MGRKYIHGKELVHISKSRRAKYGNIIHYRRLDWIHKIATMHFNRNSKKYINVWISYKHPVGHMNLTTRDSFLESLHFRDSKNISDFKFSNIKLDQEVLKYEIIGNGMI